MEKLALRDVDIAANLPNSLNVVTMNTAPLTQIAKLPEREGQPVSIRGWLYGKRSGGKIIFLLVRDGTGVCQCVVEAAQGAAFCAAESLGQESSLLLEGLVRRDDRAPGGWEIAVTTLTPIQLVENYPIARKAHGTDFLMEHRHLWIRSPRQATMLRIRHTLIRAAREFFDENGFVLIDTPILVPGAAEGAGSLFPVDYFGERAYLTQTGQLYLEAAAMALGKVYCFGPTFRAEKSKTRRHLAEFWMIEPEIAFAELPDLMQLAEQFVTHLVQRVLQRHRSDLEGLGRDVRFLENVQPPFPRITYTQAVEILHSDRTRAQLEAQRETDKARLGEMTRELETAEKQFETARRGWPQDKLAQRIQDLREDIRDLEARLDTASKRIEGARQFRWGNDLGGDEETIISMAFDRPVIITEYPAEAKAFYMKPAPHDPRVVLNMDVIAPEGYGEIIGGSQREDDLAALEKRMAKEGMDPEAYRWYCDLRRYGTVPHGGFGLGIERTLAWICGLRHIRETIPFPRLMGRMTP